MRCGDGGWLCEERRGAGVGAMRRARMVVDTRESWVGRPAAGMVRSSGQPVARGSPLGEELVGVDRSSSLWRGSASAAVDEHGVDRDGRMD